jgi:hypothetical protein
MTFELKGKESTTREKLKTVHEVEKNLNVA